MGSGRSVPGGDPKLIGDSIEPQDRIGAADLDCVTPLVERSHGVCMQIDGSESGPQLISNRAAALKDPAFAFNSRQSPRRDNRVEFPQLDLEPASSEAPKLGGEEESLDFSGLSPLRKPGGDAYVALFDVDRDCNGGDGSLIVPSGSIADFPLINASRDTTTREDGFCCPLLGDCIAAATGCEGDWVVGRCEDLLTLKPDKMAGSPCNESQLFTLNHTGADKERSVAGDGARATLKEANFLIQGVVKGEKRSPLPLEAKFSGSVPCSPDMVAFSAVEGSISLQDSHLSITAENCYSSLSVAADFPGSNSNVVNEASTRCKSGSLSVFRRSNPKRAASSRSSLAHGKPGQLTQTRNGSRKCRKDIGTRTSVLDRIPNRVTRKRSFSLRPARHSVWGTIGILTKILEQSDELASKKKRQVARKVGNMRISRTKCATTSNSVDLKEKRPVHPLSSVVNACQRSIQTGFDDSLSNSGCHIRLVTAEKTGEVDHRSGEGTHSAGVQLVQRDGVQGEKDLESTLTQDTSFENVLGECPGVSSCSGTEPLFEAVHDRDLLDPGTSPDSDVYHPVIDIGTITSEFAIPTKRDQHELVSKPANQDHPHNDVLTYTEAFATHAPVSRRQRSLLKKGKINDEVSGCSGKKGVECSFSEEHLNGLRNLNKTVNASCMPECEKQEDSNGRSHVSSKSIRKAIRKGSNCKGFEVKSSFLGMTKFECCEDPVEPKYGLEKRALPGEDVENSLIDVGTPRILSCTDQTKDSKLHRSFKLVLNRGKSSRPDSARSRRQKIHGRKKENVQRSGTISKNIENNGTLDACIKGSRDMTFPLGEANKMDPSGITEFSSKGIIGSEVVSVDGASSIMVSVGDELASKESFRGLEGHSLRPRAAWVLCDDCQKWRCIPAELADIIDETNCKWTCKDNTDKTFADCSIAQEKTNAEINAELEISDASGEDGSSRTRAQPNFIGIEPLKPAGSQPASWTVIKSNLFLHRNRKTQIIDEVMVCHCKPPLDGCLGCGDECLNRMLNIECVKGTCPCGELCSNQKFQKRKYAKFKWVRCGKKGYGLQLQENVSCGQFLIEYVGEVLDFAAYEARQRYYASRGQKHFYFMTLNGGEVIDACAKGNLGRYINHSCDPNCRTEKWMIKGEVCIGLFAIRHIKKGEEVTFDYNYERVFGAAAKKCICGSPECRGYIGGDPLNTEVIVQCDSDDEYLEPVMVPEADERDLHMDMTVSDTIDAKVLKLEQISLPLENQSGESTLTIPVLEGCLQGEDAFCRHVSDSNPLGIPLQKLDPTQIEDTIDETLADAQVSESSSHSLNSIQTGERMCNIKAKGITHGPVSDAQSSEVSLGTSTTMKEPLSDSVPNNKLILNTVEDEQNLLKPYRLAKSIRSSGAIKKAKPTDKTAVPNKGKKVSAGIVGGHFDGVDGKLKELLDEHGGISKRKDATKGYLKLLFVTASEGDNVGGFAPQSTRDLSMILDALPKTKSRMVLVDIINKNGLQMLHNIMKQNRSNFNRIPVIRKLLKILEFLALKGILTPEHINRDPPCSQMESFRDSILILTKHNDIQIHQIARNFRDKWMPRSIKRFEPSDRDDWHIGPQRSFRNRFQSPSFRYRHDQGMRETDAVICVGEAVHLPSLPCEANIPGETSLLSSHQGPNSVLTTNHPSSESRTLKRKCPWNPPSDTTIPDPQSVWFVEEQTVESSSKFMKPTTSALFEQTSQLEVLKQKSEIQKEWSSSCDEIACTMNSIRQNNDLEAPPGFGSPQKDQHPQMPSKTLLDPSEIVVGHPQERFLPHLAVSYGMPAVFMQQLGTPEVGGTQCHPHWAIAPGMPFHPFPPLPSYPRGKPNLTTPNREKTKLAYRPHMNHGAREERVRWPSQTTSYGSGRRVFRPQRYNQRSHIRPPWFRGGSNYGFRGGSRNGASSQGQET